MLQRFLDPAVLASISSLDLVAKTVVDGFVAGLHRAPTFGFSQEFAEYKAYNEGDDLRHIDWNVYARSEKLFLKRFKGETKQYAGEDKPRVIEANTVGGKSALADTALVPAALAIGFLLLLLYFYFTGGYKQVHLEGEPPMGEY